MEYTVQKLARLSGVSARALRYHDEIGLLKPARLSSSGYRIYGGAQVRRLQQILFYRELGVGLAEIGQILDSPGFSAADALRRHRELLLRQRTRLDLLIRNVEKTLACEKGKILMTDREKFEGFKENLVRQNERRYGKEIREKYGSEAVERSNRKLLGMAPEQYEQFQNVEQSLNKSLLKAFRTGDPAGEAAQQAAALHRKWLSFTWDAYTPEAHAALAQMYVDDPRFTAYYDKLQPGLAKFLGDSVKIYTDRLKKG